MRRKRNNMRLNPKEIQKGLNELLELPGIDIRLIRETKEYIRQLEADLRRQGFTEYNTKEEENDI